VWLPHFAFLMVALAQCLEVGTGRVLICAS
jgi:hypothetical protein